MKDYELMTLQLRQMVSKANMADKLSEKDALRFIETLHDIDQKLKGINHEQQGFSNYPDKQKGR